MRKTAEIGMIWKMCEMCIRDSYDTAVSVYRGVAEPKTDRSYRLGEFQSFKDGVLPFFLQLHNLTDSGWCLCIGRFSLCSVLLRCV